jgi:AraC-like DNA-binding protein
MELRNIWDVKADNSYDVSSNRAGRDLIVIRTFAGEGELYTDKPGPLPITNNSMLLVEQSKIRRYRCSDDRWNFWWFVVHSGDPLPCSLETIYDISGSESDTEDFSQIFSKLQSQSYATRCVASASFTTMFHRWLTEAKLQREQSPHRRIIETVIERIHNDVSADWTLPRLAKESGLCETLLRKEFKKATGQAPARFIREARLQAASQLIQQGVYTLAAIAEMLNFSSAFHLSAAFKKHFGTSPSEMSPTNE